MSHSCLYYEPSRRLVSWKDQSFTQITSAIQKNKNTNTSTHNLFLANPLKIYRREIASAPKCAVAGAGAGAAFGNPRVAISIDEINRPGGAIINAKAVDFAHGTTFAGKTGNTTENGTCTNPLLCAATNARARVRNSGTLRPKYVDHKSFSDGTVRNVAFFSNTNQYLNNRMMSFSKNQNPLSECVVYKPSNSAYKVQGAVSSGGHILGKKVDAIDRSAAMFYKKNGYNLAGALSYGVNENINTYKEKLGFPLANTPVVKPGTDAICKKELATLRGRTG